VRSAAFARDRGGPPVRDTGGSVKTVALAILTAALFTVLTFFVYLFWAVATG